MKNHEQNMKIIKIHGSHMNSGIVHHFSQPLLEEHEIPIENDTYCIAAFARVGAHTQSRDFS